MPSMIFYPDAHPEVSSVDGYAVESYLTLEGIPWADIVAGPGNDFNDDGVAPSNYNFAYISGSSDAGEWDGLYRGIIVYDTSELTSDSPIDRAVLSLYGAFAFDPPGWKPDINIYAAYPASDISLEAHDFARVGSVPLCDIPIAYDDWITTGYNNFILNHSGLAIIQRNGRTKFSVRNANYDVAGISPTWADNSAGLSWWQAEKGTAYRPKFTVTYANGGQGTHDIVTLEALRNIEMMGQGRFYIDKEGKAKYESRFNRSI